MLRPPSIIPFTIVFRIIYALHFHGQVQHYYAPGALDCYVVEVRQPDAVEPPGNYAAEVRRPVAVEEPGYCDVPVRHCCVAVRRRSVDGRRSVHRDLCDQS